MKAIDIDELTKEDWALVEAAIKARDKADGESVVAMPECDDKLLQKFPYMEGSEFGEYVTALTDIARMGSGYGMSNTFEAACEAERARVVKCIRENYKFTKDGYAEYIG